MNFDFSDEQKSLRQDIRRALVPLAGAAREALDDAGSASERVWSHAGSMGWIGAALPEALGGSGLGGLELCIVAEELGRIISPVPFSTTVTALEILRLYEPDLLNQWGPLAATGQMKACLALWERVGGLQPSQLTCRFENGRATGRKTPVLEGGRATHALVLCQSGQGPTLTLVDLGQPEVIRQDLSLLDPTKGAAQLDFNNAAAFPVGEPGQGWDVVQSALSRLAILLAFEQIGGAQSSLEMAVAYAKQRYAFSRPIGSFQGIKHKLADVYTAVEVARSHAFYGAWALSTQAAELDLAAAAARVSASEAYSFAAEEAMQTHGGIGYTWASDCHMHLRRAKFLALQAGAPDEWREKLVSAIERRNIA